MGYGEQLIQQGIEIGERRGLEIGQRRGLEIGEHNGRVAQAVELLTERFGALPSWALEHLQGADKAELLRVLRDHSGAASLESLLARSS